MARKNIMNKKQMLGVPATILEDGTIKLPNDMLEFAGISLGGAIEIFADKDAIFIRTADIFCDFCGQNGNMDSVGDMLVCPECLDELNKKANSFR